MEPDLLASALWGLAGAVPYAATVLTTALWKSAEIDTRTRKLAVANFMTAIFTGPAFAGALTPVFMAKFHTTSLAATALLIGMFANSVWPILTDKRVLTPVVRALLERLGTWMTGASKAMDTRDDL